jgi:osmotically-inducible protein OsmY
MKTKLAIGSILIGALLAPTATVHADSDQDRSSARASIADSVITAKIKTRFAEDQQVSAFHIKVDTDDHGIVQLLGRARTQQEADRAVELAQNVKGVVLVQNNIRIADYRPVKSKPESPIDAMAPGGA